jgi:drug/metabolite transporter (DMT)-like permease
MGIAAKPAGGRAVVFHMMLSPSLTLVALFALFGSFAMPHSMVGWLGFGGFALYSTIGTLVYFCAVPMIGAVRATMIGNVEPLIGILLAVAILGECLSIAQGGGVSS